MTAKVDCSTCRYDRSGDDVTEQEKKCILGNQRPVAGTVCDEWECKSIILERE